jgi:ribosomal protein L32
MIDINKQTVKLNCPNYKRSLTVSMKCGIFDKPRQDLDL